MFVENPHKVGEFIECYPEKAARDAFAKKFPAVAQEKRRVVRNPEFEIEKRTRYKVHRALRDLVSRQGFTNADLIEIGIAQLEYGDSVDDELADLWGLAKEHSGDEAEAKLRAATGGELLAMLFDLFMPPAFMNHAEAHEQLAKVHGIDVKALEREAKAEIKAESKPGRKVEEEEGAEA